ncbi:pyridoxal-phosphate dependent enzyme [Dethiosulfatarculus sandiegensis]|uniref:Pyridoxal-5-phosphate-dependent protein subunit beta n=1 Tax=Dethiosulfatarculus sandiegensis TaxID=1429043 RepID=A0A0D2HSU9_9BACT|nr:pyridoxal-phosphate dependent enzyme [Dethiosulfatarculus sandiegensis]KIX13608.1 pyridoxal-5-phosphate-dependent protein subunit beta [Dethiosulfatarculus sandiegensis]
MIDLKVNEKVLDKTVQYCREKGIALPTFAMMKDPAKVPEKIKERLSHTGLWDVDPANLFRITWKNEPRPKGGLYNGVNHFVLGPEITGCRANIVFLAGRWFPTGAHKVGATYGCLAPRLVTGQFDPQKTKAVWPSTGNYCRGGAYISALLACQAIAILPEGMSQERFDWLKSIAGEVIATPGCESNVKEIFDKCWELRNSGQDLQIFNQFDELGNPLWHYTVTGSAIEELMTDLLTDGKRFAGYVASSGSAGTLGAGYYLRKKYPGIKVAVGEAVQCPTLLLNGFGDHRIEGIGDKHIPWVHDCKETDFIIGVDDEAPLRMLRLFNEPAGREALIKEGVDENLVNNLDLFGISGVGNLVAAIKFAKYNELTENDYVVTIATDSLELYDSRLRELTEERGVYKNEDAQRDLELINSITFDYTKELTYYDKKAIHNLKYFTWVEQQGRDLAELNAQWYDHDNYWQETFNKTDEIDRLITEFNDRVGLL